MSSDDNLRQFVMRRAASESHQKVVLHAKPDTGCPMHGRNGSFQLPSGSRVMSREANLRANHSLPRDVFKGKIDFKSTLRRVDPKEEERNRNNSGFSGRYVSRHEGEVRRGMIVDSDFDFRGGTSREPSWDNPGRFRIVHTNKAVRGPSLSVDIDMANRVRTPDPADFHRRDEPISPRRCESNPISPRRVEFGEEIVFDFNPRTIKINRSHSGIPSKPILRHTNSDSREIPIIRKEEPDISNDQSDSLVQIFVPPSQTDKTNENDNSSEETIQGDQSEEEEKQTKLRRKVPPPLADWNRSQSFPMASANNNSMRKQSLPDHVKLANQSKSINK